MTLSQEKYYVDLRTRNLQKEEEKVHRYTDNAGPEISVNSRIASPFSQQIAIGNAGPSSALESTGAKPSFRCHLLNIAPIYKQ